MLYVKNNMRAAHAGQRLFLCPPRSCLAPVENLNKKSPVSPFLPLCYSRELQRAHPSVTWSPADGNATLAEFLRVGFHPTVC